MGDIVTVGSLPTCSFCDADARLDVRMTNGPWANLCIRHASDALTNGLWSGSLGTGYGQVLALNDDPSVRDEVLRAIGSYGMVV